MKPIQAAWAAFVLLASVAGTSRADTLVTVFDPSTGQTETITDTTGTIAVTASREKVVVQATPASGGPGWAIWIQSPEDDVLHPGLFSEVTCAPVPAGRAMGLHVSRGEQLCEYFDTIYGWVSLRQLKFNPDGTLASLEMLFNQRVGSERAPATYGTVRYNANPMYARFQASKKSPFGLIDIEGHGDDSILRGSGRQDDFIHTHLSLPKQNWTSMIIPSRNQPIQTGRFPVMQSYTGTTWQLAVNRHMTPVRCPDEQPWSGWLDVKAIGVNPNPQNEWYHYSGFWIEFEITCPGKNKQPLRGEVRVGV